MGQRLGVCDLQLALTPLEQVSSHEAVWYDGLSACICVCMDGLLHQHGHLRW